MISILLSVLAILTDFFINLIIILTVMSPFLLFVYLKGKIQKFKGCNKCKHYWELEYKYYDYSGGIKIDKQKYCLVLGKGYKLHAYEITNCNKFKHK